MARVARKQAAPKTCPPLAELLQEVSESVYFNGESPLRLNTDAVRADCPLHLVIGDNGAGKSFLVQVLSAYARSDDCTPLQISMAYRTRAGIERAFMYGSDEDHSTGLNSIGVVRRAISSMQGWGSKAHIALFDEPDTGLSDRYAHPLGALIAQFATAPADGTKGVLIITHSRALVRGALGVLEQGGHEPSVAFVGSRYSSLDQFLGETAPATVEEMLEVEGSAHTTWRCISKMLEPRK
ncbi:MULTISPECIES: ATP-binding cassette domain-containing protein [unclassified Variovorax]|uniref:ATP-binding cassette domain-containing protein n=1 Tax=unclassified Variovorax TaxID=663243 RepID=UPI0013169C11|nr:MULTISPECIES: ABC transporter ATP-binding protein [unclassified Variovorax]VTU42836.1 putative ATPase [Variovorax sp. PBL-H6]VTU43643.1 putative ATPase [Variovorax sp. SRS16]VTU43707.1 putative ATPase [Variovorax sp. PBL-E5]